MAAASQYWLVFLVFVGGGMGSVLRYWLSPLNTAAWPMGTLVANVLACVLLGVLIALQSSQKMPELYLWLGTGFCGGLSTFSTWVMELGKAMLPMSDTSVTMSTANLVLYGLLSIGLGMGLMWLSSRICLWWLGQ